MNFGGRRSIFKNVFGSVPQGTHYSNLRITTDFGDSTGIKANPKYLSVIWQSGGGGAFTVLPHEQEQRLPDNNIRLFAGHSAPVLDTDWNPFDDEILASASGDATVGIWKVPDEFTPIAESDEEPDILPIAKLTGHQKPIRLVLFNPSAGNVLASASTDSSVMIWDINHQAPLHTIKMEKSAASISWDATGKYLVTVPQYGQPTIWDPRTGSAVIKFPTTSSSKARRVLWLGEQDKIVTTGKCFGDGQVALWDVKNPSSALSTDQWGQASSILTPFWDEGTKMLYLTIKGERTIKYYELNKNELDEVFYYQGTEAHSGVTFMPKRGANVRAKELTRAFRIIGGNAIEPVPFILPRTQDAFIPEAYPPAVGLTPYSTAQEWSADPTIAGIPVKFSLEGLWSGSGLTTVVKGESASTSDLKSAVAAPPTTISTTSSSPAGSNTPKIESKALDSSAEYSSPAAGARGLTDPKKVTSSIANAASKFADNTSNSDKEDDSSFPDAPIPSRGIASRMAAYSGAASSVIPKSASTPPPTAASEAASPSSPSKRELEKLVSLGEKCQTDIGIAQKSLDVLTTELKAIAASLDGESALKERIKKLTH